MAGGTSQISKEVKVERQLFFGSEVECEDKADSRSTTHSQVSRNVAAPTTSSNKGDDFVIASFDYEKQKVERDGNNNQPN